MFSNTENVFCSSSSSSAVCYCEPITRKPFEPKPLKPFQIDISKCPPPPITNVHVCFGCWKNYDENQRRQLIIRAISSFIFSEKESVLDEFMWMKNFFITHKIYDEEDPIKFAQFWIRIYCRSRISNGLDTFVDESGKKINVRKITSISANGGGGN